VSAAAHAIVNQVYSLGVVVMIAIQSTGATLVPSALSKASTNEGASDGADAVDNVVAARRVADRLIGWAVVISLGMAGVQALAMPLLLPLFTPLAEVRAAVIQPARISALVQLTNGFVFAGEGIMIGVGAFGFLAGLTAVGVSVMVIGLWLSSRLGLGVSSVWLSLLAFHLVQLGGTMYHHLHLSPLAKSQQGSLDGTGAVQPPSSVVECTTLPGVGEVCVTDVEPDEA